MVKNPLCNSRDVGPIPGQGTKILHAVGQLGLSNAPTEPLVLQLESTLKRKTLHDTVKIPHAATKTRLGQRNKLNIAGNIQLRMTLEDPPLLGWSQDEED